MRRSLLFGCPFAFVALLAGAAGAPPSEVAPGVWELNPAPSATVDEGSYLCVKRGVLLDLLCGPGVYDPEVAGAEDVRLHVNNDGGGNSNVTARAALRDDDGGVFSGEFTLRLLDVAGATDDDVPCGAWSWRFVNQPGVSEPPTPVTKSGGGMIAALLTVPGELEFESGQGIIHSLPYRLTVAFNGSSALVPLAEAGALLTAGYSNLLLLAQDVNACYLAAPSPWTTGECGLLRMQVSAPSLALANGSGSGTCGALGH